MARCPIGTLQRPRSGVRPCVGFSAAIPQNAAGMRTLPPMSVPMPSGEPPAATIAPSPPLLPPGARSRFHGLFVRPYTGLLLSTASSICATFVLPSTIAPAARSRATYGSSASAACCARDGSPNVDGSPAKSKHSLIVTGTPCSAPSGSPAARRLSASRASARASS